MLKLMKRTFGNGCAVMKKYFTYKGGYVFITADYGDQKSLT
jgi:hypothetical protein